MAASNVYPVGDEDTIGYHEKCYSFKLENTSVLETWSAQENYHTNYRTLPTSWWFQLSFQRSPEDGSVSWHVIFRRDDSNAGTPVKIFVYIAFFAINGRLLNFPSKVCSDTMLPGNELQEYISPSPIPNYMENLPQLKLEVEVFIFVRGCHRHGNPEVWLSNDLGKMSI